MSQASQSAPFRLLIEGWRDLPHSYSIVNQFQCLELLNRPDVYLRHRDMPYFIPHWRKTPGLFDPETESRLATIPPPHPGETFDAVLRMDFRHRVTPDPAAKVTAVFMTAEYGRILNGFIFDQNDLHQALNNVIYITPSHYSAAGLRASNPGNAPIHVVPHGIDPHLFAPLPPDQRAQLRHRFAFHDFVFASFGAMSGNKQMPILLKAFAAVTARHPNTRLLLKGLDAIYNSKHFLMSAGSLLTAEERKRVEPRITYRGDTYSFKQMAELYQTIDAYVSPSAAEAFNMPVLEAIACGTPVICTAGSPTDDFTRDDFALRVDSTPTQIIAADAQPGTSLRVSLESLTEKMLAAIEDPSIAPRARIAGPDFIANGFHWSQVVTRLLNVLQSPQHP